MSREIKFRHIKPDGSVEFEQLNREMSEGYIEQYTGLKDKNGKEIYEGDIVRTKNKIYGGTVCFTVGFEYGGFTPFTDTSPDVVDLDSPEIIGNIHENPELLDKNDGES